MTKTRHKRTAVASMFQNGISRNTKCAERDSFRTEGHISFCSYAYVGSQLAVASYSRTVAYNYIRKVRYS